MGIIRWDRTAFRIAVIYVMVGILWILCFNNFSPYLEGGLFIACTALILFIFISRRMSKMKSSVEQLAITNDELLSVQRELIASREELQRKFAELQAVNAKISTQNYILSSLHETTLGLMNHLELDEVLHAIVFRAADLMGTEHAFIFVLNREDECFERKVATGVYAKDMGRKIRIGEGLTGVVHRTGQAIILEDYSCWDSRIKDPFFDNIHGIIHVPLKSATEIRGSFGLAFTDPGRRFSEADIALLEQFAELASIAIENASLYLAAQRELAERIQADTRLN